MEVKIVFIVHDNSDEQHQMKSPSKIGQQALLAFASAPVQQNFSNLQKICSSCLLANSDVLETVGLKKVSSNSLDKSVFQTQISWKQVSWNNCLENLLITKFLIRLGDKFGVHPIWWPIYHKIHCKYLSNNLQTFWNIWISGVSSLLHPAGKCRYLPQTLGGRTTFAILQGNSWQGNTRLSTFFKTATSFRLVDPSIRSCSHQKAKILRSSQKGLWRPCLKVVEFSEPLKGFVMGHWSPVEPTRANQTPCVKSRVLKSRLGGECSAKRANAA